MIWHWTTSHFNKGGRQVNTFNQGITCGAPRGVRLNTRIINNQGNFNRRLMEQIFFPKPMITKIITMVRSQHDHCVLHPACSLKVAQQTSKLVITLLNQPHIGWDHLVPHIFSLKSRGNLIAHVSPINWVGIFPLNFMAPGWLYVVGAKHIVVRRRHNVWPVGLYVAHMRHPRTLSLIDKIDSLSSQPWCFAVLLTNVGRFIGITKHPARRNLLITDAGIGIISPRVFTIIALRLKILIIGTAALIIKPVRPIAPKPVITHPIVKPTF